MNCNTLNEYKQLWDDVLNYPYGYVESEKYSFDSDRQQFYLPLHWEDSVKLNGRSAEYGRFYNYN